MKNIMNYLYFLLLLNYNGFELMSAWYNNNTSNILFSLISLIRHFKKLWALNFVILMSASSYEWNVLQSAVWQCSLETHPFFLDCFVSCGLILWIAIKKTLALPKFTSVLYPAIRCFLLQKLNVTWNHHQKQPVLLFQKLQVRFKQNQLWL